MLGVFVHANPAGEQTEQFACDFKFWCVLTRSPSTALNLVHTNSFRKLSNFPQNLTELCKYPGGANFEKHADPEKKIYIYIYTYI